MTAHELVWVYFDLGVNYKDTAASSHGNILSKTPKMRLVVRFGARDKPLWCC